MGIVEVAMIHVRSWFSAAVRTRTGCYDPPSNSRCIKTRQWMVTGAGDSALYQQVVGKLSSSERFSCTPATEVRRAAGRRDDMVRSLPAFPISNGLYRKA